MGSSDHELYQLFKAEPRFLDVFVEMNPNHAYTFDSLTFKRVQRQCDGVLISSDPDEATVIFEFQMQRKPCIYARMISEIGLYQHYNPDKLVRGVIIFLNPATDPGHIIWKRVAETCPEALKVLYLNQVYLDLKRTEPESPLQAVFAPFVETDSELIRQNARKWSEQLNQLPYTKTQRETFLKVFMSWLVDALPDLSEKELMDMTSLVRDISHTRFYKDVEARLGPKFLEKGRQEGLERGLEQGLERGLEQGLERGLEQGIEQLRELYHDGTISKESFEQRVAAMKARV